MCGCTQPGPFGCRNLYFCGCACHDPAIVPDEPPEPPVSEGIKAFINRLEVKP